MITLYGLKNCDTCRKALKWMDAQKIDCRFRDVRADGVSHKQIAGWVGDLGWETVLNRRSTTWRGLSDSEKADIDDAHAIALMETHPTLIKRPVIEMDGIVTVGFTKETEAALKQAST